MLTEKKIVSAYSYEFQKKKELWLRLQAFCFMGSGSDSELWFLRFASIQDTVLDYLMF